MIPYTPALQAAFAPFSRNFGDVVITKVPAPINALKILLDLGLPVHKSIVVMEFEDNQTWNRTKFVSSYQYLEEGTENDNIQNNVATYNPAMGTLTIHWSSGKSHVGRGHSKALVKSWLDASFCFAP